MMKSIALGLLGLGCGAALAQEPAAPPKKAEALKLERTIALPDVAGRIDHLALDAQRKHLFIAALGNDTLELVDLAEGKRTKSFGGHKEPQAVAYLTLHDRLVVSNGEGQGCDVYDADKLAIVQKIELGADADNVRYDQAHDRVWVAHGDGKLSAFDAPTGKVEATVQCAGHVESFQLENSGARIFANVPGAEHVAVIDREQQKIIATWPLTAHANFPMAFAESRALLFIGCRSPARLLVLDASSGKQLAEVELSGDVDDLFFDEARSRLYAICGEGFVDVFDVASEKPQRTAHVATRAGARTGQWDPDQSRLFVAVPQREGASAELRVFSVP
jgi:hypothetical protein